MNEHNDKTATVENKSDATMLRELLFYVVIPLAIAIALALGGCASGHRSSGYSSGAEKIAPTGVTPEAGTEDRLGIRMEGLRLSSAGYILDFRYRVIDPDKAAPLMDRKTRPYLLDEASGAQLGVPDTAKLGQLRTTGRNKVVTDQDYFILFANPGRYVQAGNRMTLVMGGLRIEHITVQ
ncbi:MAG: hypothetical protein HZB47_02865 [Nitrosomonadales bacterium]|nr:hypothetical protein [Nitrosomonadales bacterium]